MPMNTFFVTVGQLFKFNNLAHELKRIIGLLIVSLNLSLLKWWTIPLRISNELNW